MKNHRLWNFSYSDSPSSSTDDRATIDVFSSTSVTSEILTRLLKDHIGNNNKVVSFSIKQPILDTCTSFLYHITLSYENQSPSCPSTVIVKVSKENQKSIDQQQWISEVNFYKYFAPQIPVIVPKCYYASYNQQTKFGLLIIEDLLKAKQYPIDQGIPEQQVTKIIDLLAEIHAQFWHNPNRSETTLHTVPWLKPINHPIWKHFIHQVYRYAWQQNNHENYKTHSIERLQLHFDFRNPNTYSSR